MADRSTGPSTRPVGRLSVRGTEKPFAALAHTSDATALKVGDRVAAEGLVAILSSQDDRILITVTFPGTPTPITLDSIWSNCAACDLQIGSKVRLAGQLERINDVGDTHWDTGSVRFDGLNYAIPLPMCEIKAV
jgi:hypothetical protein